MVYAIIQARMNSSRLPGKVLMDLCGQPVLMHVVSRLGHSKKIDSIIVATTVSDMDNSLANYCNKNNILCFRGSEGDVLDRFYQAALNNGANEGDYIVRITADCPFIDPQLVDSIIEAALENRRDYTSNTLNPTYPDGLDTEVFKFSALKRAWEDATLRSEREHVTPYIYKHPELFSLFSYESNHNHSFLRWTLDEPEDYTVIEKVYQKLYNTDKVFLTKDILNLYTTDKSIFETNSVFTRNEGYFKSLSEDNK